MNHFDREDIIEMGCHCITLWPARLCRVVVCGDSLLALQSILDGVADLAWEQRVAIDPMEQRRFVSYIQPSIRAVRHGSDLVSSRGLMVGLWKKKGA